ncbi:putative glycosyltransferase, MGT family [Nocardia nova SH22a]|uniref:Putative glycosyltransferase, MGT family n=1 Tax=Nocardia nova SH22a TaxID=1415166 RepID=W5TG65_9NOCA|nr:putative glycosyltransferase, MGT family [Nocardia nova SH22a]
MSPGVDHKVRVPAGRGPSTALERMSIRHERRTAWAATKLLIAAEMETERPELCVVDPHIPWIGRLVRRRGGMAVPLWTTHARRRISGPVLVNAVPELQPGRQRLGPEVHFVGPLLKVAGSSGANATDPSAAGRDREQTVVVAVGTVFARSAEFFRDIAASFAGSQWRVVIATGQLPVAELGDLPPNVFAYQWIPQSAMLRRAAVFITHAGMNSIHEAVVAGTPMIVSPRSREQRLNASRLRRLGLAEPLEPPSQLLDQAARISSNAVLSTRLREFRQHVRAVGGTHRAADLLLDIALSAS